VAYRHMGHGAAAIDPQTVGKIGAK
jgi:hypothetical protein